MTLVLVLPMLDLKQAINGYASLAACSSSSDVQRDAMSVLAGLDLCQDDYRPVHSDLGCHNIIERDENGIVFLDWEYGGLFDPLFDLAGIVHQNGLNDAGVGYASRGLWRKYCRQERVPAALCRFPAIVCCRGRALAACGRCSPINRPAAPGQLVSPKQSYAKSKPSSQLALSRCGTM